MDLISAEEVIRRIEWYFKGGVVSYLTPDQARAARKGVLATSRSNTFDEQPLNLHNARLACESFIKPLPEYPGTFEGRGIVICGGGVKYFTNAWVNISMLRKLGCSLPIELWHLGEEEVDKEMPLLLKEFDVECVDALKVRKRHPVRRLKGGWELKSYAILHCPFREVLFLDADNVPVVNPEFLFESQPYRETGAIFWPDYGQLKKSQTIWDSCGLERPEGPEFESGQIVVDKERCWKALRLALWFNEHSDFYYQHIHGDKETFHLAFRKLGKSFAMPQTPIHPLEGTMCQHDFAGNRIFQHRNTDKWNLLLNNKRVEDFWFEADCRSSVKRLQEIWDGRMSRYGRVLKNRERVKIIRPPTIFGCMISCPERTEVRERTLQNLAATDWGSRPVCVQMDQGTFTKKQERQTHTSYLALRQGVNSGAEYILFLEDDLEFNRWFHHNLLHWSPLAQRIVALGGLYNPGVKPLACDVNNHATVVDPQSVFGSQAFLISLRAAEFFLQHWSEVEGMQDIKMSRLAAKMKRPIFYHAPSLVQHLGIQSVWGGFFHQAPDYDPNWRSVGEEERPSNLVRNNHEVRQHLQPAHAGTRISAQD